MALGNELVGGRTYVMQLSKSSLPLPLSSVFLVALVASACNSVGQGTRATSGVSDPTPTVAVAATSSPDNTVPPASSTLPSSSGGGSHAFTQCSAIIGDIPRVAVRSGIATLAAAYDVTGAELANYLETSFAQNAPGWSISSSWRDQPAATLSMCIFDGDFSTMTPGPPGHDTSAVRVLVVIAGTGPQLWRITRQAGAIPTNDPALMPMPSDGPA